MDLDTVGKVLLWIATPVWTALLVLYAIGTRERKFFWWALVGAMLGLVQWMWLSVIGLLLGPGYPGGQEIAVLGLVEVTASGIILLVGLLRMRHKTVVESRSRDAQRALSEP